MREKPGAVLEEAGGRSRSSVARPQENAAVSEDRPETGTQREQRRHREDFGKRRTLGTKWHISRVNIEEIWRQLKSIFTAHYQG